MDSDICKIALRIRDANVGIGPLEAIDTAHQAVDGLSYDEFRRRRFTQFGVERAIEIVSEAVRHVLDDVLATQPQIPWPDVRATGNLTRHEYWRIDYETIWAIVTDDFPALRNAINTNPQ